MTNTQHLSGFKILRAQHWNSHVYVQIYALTFTLCSHTHTTQPPNHTPHTHLSMPPTHTSPSPHTPKLIFLLLLSWASTEPCPPTHTSPSLPRTPTLKPLPPPAPPHVSPHTPSHSQFSFPFTPHTLLPPPHSDTHSSFTAVSGLHHVTATALPFSCSSSTRLKKEWYRRSETLTDNSLRRTSARRRDSSVPRKARGDLFHVRSI